jgi:hypothetical protein
MADFIEWAGSPKTEDIAVEPASVGRVKALFR